MLGSFCMGRCSTAGRPDMAEPKAESGKSLNGAERIRCSIMQNTEIEDVVEIDLQELLGMLIHRAWLICACGVLCGLAAFLVSRFLIIPRYESSTSVYILNKSNENTITYSDVQLGSTLTKDYAQLITSRGVLEKVIESCSLEDSIEELKKRVDVKTLTDTRLIVITVTDETPFMAYRIANVIREEASMRIEEVMDIEAVNMVDEANLPEKPSSPSVGMWSFIGLLAGMLLCAGVLTVQFLNDDTVKTSEDVEKYLEMSTLAIIPIIEKEGAGSPRRRARKKAPPRHTVSYKEPEEKYEEDGAEYEGDGSEGQGDMIEIV